MGGSALIMVSASLWLLSSKKAIDGGIGFLEKVKVGMRRVGQGKEKGEK